MSRKTPDTRRTDDHKGVSEHQDLQTLQGPGCAEADRRLQRCKRVDIEFGQAGDGRNRVPRVQGMVLVIEPTGLPREERQSVPGEEVQEGLPEETVKGEIEMCLIYYELGSLLFCLLDFDELQELIYLMGTTCLDFGLDFFFEYFIKQDFHYRPEGYFCLKGFVKHRVELQSFLDKIFNHFIHFFVFVVNALCNGVLVKNNIVFYLI